MRTIHNSYFWVIWCEAHFFWHINILLLLQVKQKLIYLIIIQLIIKGKKIVSLQISCVWHAGWKKNTDRRVRCVVYYLACTSRSPSSLIKIKTLITPCMSASRACMCASLYIQCLYARLSIRLRKHKSNIECSWWMTPAAVIYICRWLGCYYVRYQCEQRVCAVLAVAHTHTHAPIWKFIRVRILVREGRGRWFACMPLVGVNKRLLRPLFW